MTSSEGPSDASESPQRVTMELLSQLRRADHEDESLAAYLGWRLYDLDRKAKSDETYRSVQPLLDTLHPKALELLHHLNTPTLHWAMKPCLKEWNFRSLNNLVYFVDIFRERPHAITTQDSSDSRDNLYKVVAGLESDRGRTTQSFAPKSMTADFSLYTQAELDEARLVVKFILQTRTADYSDANPIWISADLQGFIVSRAHEIDYLISIVNTHDLNLENAADLATFQSLLESERVHGAFVDGLL